jgi:hypothetical protein
MPTHDSHTGDGDRLHQYPFPTEEQAAALGALRALLAEKQEGVSVSSDSLGELRRIVWKIPPAHENQPPNS